MINRIIFIVILIFACWLFIKYVEKRNTFFPMKKVDFTPRHIDLSYEDINFRTSDGLTLNGWFVPAKKARATVLFFHGNAGNMSHRVEVVDILHKAGLNIFIFDYRGYGKSEGTPSEKGTYIDTSAAYDYLIKRDDVVKDAIVFYGKSLGAAIAVDAATRLEHAALIIESPFTSIRDMAKEIYPFLPSGLIVSAGYDSISKIPGISSPKLVIHSEDDEIIPYEHGKRLFNKAKEPKEFFTMRGGHNDAALLAKDEFRKAIESFLDRYGII